MPNSQTGESSAKEYNLASGSNFGLAQMDPVSLQPGPTDPMSIGQGILAVIWNPLEDSSTSYD